jgi:hypothetical protein
MMAKEFDISFLCPVRDWRACKVLAAIGGWRRSASASEAARFRENFFSGDGFVEFVEMRQFVEATYIGDTTLVADDNDFRSALDR